MYFRMLVVRCRCHKLSTTLSYRCSKKIIRCQSRNLCYQASASVKSKRMRRRSSVKCKIPLCLVHLQSVMLLSISLQSTEDDGVFFALKLPWNSMEGTTWSVSIKPVHPQRATRNAYKSSEIRSPSRDSSLSFPPSTWYFMCFAKECVSKEWMVAV